MKISKIGWRACRAARGSMGSMVSMVAMVLMGFGTSSAFAQRKVCIDADWEYADRMISLPHDWSVEQGFDPQGDYQKGFMKGGEAWYRKALSIPESDRENLLRLYFEGVYNHATIFLNGEQIYFNHYGYQSFRVELPERLIHYGGDNEIVVKCENKGNNTRWYSGSGIFRHVWLLRNPKDLWIDEWNCHVVASPQTSPNGEGVDAEISISVTIPYNHPLNSTYTINILDGEKIVASVQQPRHSALCTLHLKDARLWSAESPYMYKAEIIAGKDKAVIPFGIRTVETSLEKGLLISGESVLLKGGCVHHDLGLLGAASYDDGEVRKIKLLKEYGFNAVRCSHNLPSEKFLQACDSLGMYVIDECFDQWYDAKNDSDYHNYFADHYQDDLRTMLRRDRNHPSVVMWSIGNEIPGRTKEYSMLAARTMRDIIMKEDGTRPVTAALCYWDNSPVNWKEDSWKVTQSLDVVGYNYMWGEYDRDVKVHHQLMCGTETYPKEASQNWDRVEKYPQLIGDFVWTAMDYLGEAGIGHGLFVKDGEQSPFFMPYPYFNGWCGDIDLIGEKKPQSYYRDVVWGIRPITMAVELPCPQGYHREISGWGWQPEVNAWEKAEKFYTEHNIKNIVYGGNGGNEGNGGNGENSFNSPYHVNIYSKSPQVRLYLNGRLIGTKPTSETYHAAFEVEYEPGVLRAVEWDGTQEGASFELQTTGKPAAIRLKTDKYDDLIFITAELVDKQGRVVHEYERKVEFGISGTRDFGNSGIPQILTAGNANPTDTESFRSLTPRFYDGRAMVVVQSAGCRVQGAELIVKSGNLKTKIKL